MRLLLDLLANIILQQAELSKGDMINGVPILLSKITEYRPRIVCFVGKGIWDVFLKEATKNITTSSSSSLTSTGETSSTSGKDESEPAVELDPAASIALAMPTPKRRKNGKSKKTGKAKIAFNWGIQPVKVAHPDSGHGMS